MARAEALWVVSGNHGELLAAFTVKHELRTWLARQPEDRPLRVQRIVDGGHDPDARPVDYHPRTLDPAI